MEQDTRLYEVLEQLEKNSRKQLFASRLQCLFSIICAVCCAILLISVLRFLPQIETIIAHADAVLSNLDVVTQELAKLDLAQMLENINGLVSTSQAGVEDALSKINEIDFDTLNQAVKDLSNVVKPLADFVKRITLGGLL